MEFTYKPHGPVTETVDDNGKPLHEGNFEDYFDGHIKLKLKPKSERMNLAQEFGLEHNDEGQVEVKKSKNLKDTAAKIDKFIQDSVLEWSLKSKDGSMEFKNIEELGYFDTGMHLINKLGFILMRGPSLGKSLKT